MFLSHGSQTQKINIAQGATRDVRIALIDTATGVLIPNAIVVAAGGIAVAVGCEFIPGNTDPSIGMTASVLIQYSGIPPAAWAVGDNCGYIYDSTLTALDGQFIYRIGITVAETATLGYNGRIRFFDLGAMGAVVMEEVWLEYNVVRLNDSQFQNVMLGSQEVGSNQMKMYPQSALGSGTYILYDLYDQYGNPTSVQPVAKEFNAVTGAPIPE